MDNFFRKYFDKSAGKTDYEKQRWLKDEASKEQFKENLKTIMFHLNKKFSKALEIGSGPGTWTKILARKSRVVVAVDISKEMIKQAEKKRLKNVKYICKDFVNFNSKEKFDLIFSSRAVEYIRNIDVAIEKMYSLLDDKGKLILITKNPARRWKQALFNKKIEGIHKNWIEAEKMGDMLEKKGFQKIEIYPAIFSCLPFPNNILVRKLNSAIHELFYRNKINIISLPFFESYAAVAYKNL